MPSGRSARSRIVWPRASRSGDIQDLRGTVFVRRGTPAGWIEIDSTTVDTPGRIDPPIDPYAMETGREPGIVRPAPGQPTAQVVKFYRKVPNADRARSVVRMPSFEQVAADPVLYAHASRILHLESNPGNARALVQRHGDIDVWLNPPPIPLTTREMDGVYELPYRRVPHPSYGAAKIPAYEMIRFSVAIQRGCFGGCTFCSITEHEGRIIQSRSEDSVIREIETVRDTVPGFTGVISDLGGPTANMYRLACKSREIESACRRPSCVFPGICPNLDTDHAPLIRLYRRARALPGVKKVLIASGVRYDLATESPEYVKELAQHHVGGYLKIAPEAIAEGPLSKMMKPGVGTYDRFKALFDKYSKEAGKEQYLIPYFIAAHPGTTDEDMLELALWLKRNGFRADQVQAFLPSPMATATAMYHSGKNPLRKVNHRSEEVVIPKGLRVRRLHKAFLRYHDANNWPLLREALRRMGRADLIGNGKRAPGAGLPADRHRTRARRQAQAAERRRRRSARSTPGCPTRRGRGEREGPADWGGRSRHETPAPRREGSPMDLVTVAAVVQTVAVVIAVGFGIMQIREFAAARRRTAAYALMQSFQSPQILRAIITLDCLPDDAPKSTIEALPTESQVDLINVMAVWESLGILVHKGEVTLAMVDDFYSGTLIQSHCKLRRYVAELRSETGRDTRWEWFEWLADRMVERESGAPPIPANIQYRAGSHGRKNASRP